MNKFLRFIFIALFLSACSDNSDHRTFKTIDPAFDTYVKIFEELYGQPVDQVGLGFMILPSPQVGVCKVWSNGRKEIFIDPQNWESADENSKTGLILHELGHCVLGRQHVDSMVFYDGNSIKGQVPVSLMYPYNFFHDGLDELKSYYFYELFNSGSWAPKHDDCSLKKKEKNSDFIEFIN